MFCDDSLTRLFTAATSTRSSFACDFLLLYIIHGIVFSQLYNTILFIICEEDHCFFLDMFFYLIQHLLCWLRLDAWG